MQNFGEGLLEIPPKKSHLDSRPRVRDGKPRPGPRAARIQSHGDRCVRGNGPRRAGKGARPAEPRVPARGHAPPGRIIWLYDLAFDPRRLLLTSRNRFFAFEGDRLRRTFVDANSTRLLPVTLIRRLLASAGMRLAGVFSTGEGVGLRSMRKDD